MWLYFDAVNEKSEPSSQKTVRFFCVASVIQIPQQLLHLLPPLGGGGAVYLPLAIWQWYQAVPLPAPRGEKDLGDLCKAAALLLANGIFPLETVDDEHR